MVRKIFLIAAVLLMASRSYADCGSSVYGGQCVNRVVGYGAHSSYNAFNVKQKNVQFQIFDPYHGHQNQFYYNGYNPYQLNLAYVPASNLGLQYYYRVRDDLDQEGLADKVADKVTSKLAKEGYVAHRDQQPSQPPAVSPGPDPTPNPPTDDSNGITQKAWQLLKSRCTSCHSGDNPSGGMVILEGGQISKNLTTQDKWTIFDRVDGSGLDAKLIMPKNGDQLSNEEVAIIREWARQ